MADIPDFQTTEEGRQYENEIMLVLQGEKKDYPSYFGGLKIASGQEFKVPSPIDESIEFGIFQEPEEGIMSEAVSAAAKAYGPWSVRPREERAKYFEPVVGVLKARRMHYAAVITVSTGMVREDALMEVDSAIEAIETAISDVSFIRGKKPLGVWAIITAHNSPFASPVGFAVAAMIAGNTVVMNPSKYCPAPVYMFYELMEKYGLPDGVLNLIVDRKDSSTEDLANDMRVMGIAASGSGDRLEDLMFLQVDEDLRFINEVKGMNPAIVIRPSDMKTTVKNIIDSAFSYSGQRLQSCSKVIITRDDYDKFLDVMAEFMKDVKVDDPVNDTAFTGPVISMDEAKRFSRISMEVLPFVIAKSKPVPKGMQANYVQPIVVSGLDFDNDLNFMDSGLPILNVVVVDSVDKAFEELEDTECGLSAGIFTKDPKLIDRFKAEADVQQFYVNESSRILKPASKARLANFVE